MSRDILLLVDALAREKNVAKDTVFLALEMALASATKKKYTEDIDVRVAEIAAARSVSANDVYASLQKSQRLPELEHAITEEKVFAFLLPQSTVEEVKS